MRSRSIALASFSLGIALTCAVPSYGQTFQGPTTGGGSQGTVIGAKLLYADWVFPIVNHRVSFPDCTSFAVASTGALSGRAVTPSCKPGAGAPKGMKIHGQVQQRTMADGRVMTIVVDPDRPAEVTVIDDGKSKTPTGTSGRLPQGQTTADPFQLEPGATRKIPGQPTAKGTQGVSTGQQSADPFKLDAPIGSTAATGDKKKPETAPQKTTVAKPGAAAKPPCDPKLKPGTIPAPGAKPPCDPKKAPNS